MHLEFFDPTESPIDPLQIDGTELLLGVRYPASYRKVLASHHNAYGDADFPVPGTTHGANIGHWLSLAPWDTSSIWSCLSTWQEHKLPRLVVPFGGDGGGNLICFDYRISKEPSIAFWYHELRGEDGLATIAPTFDHFLSLLKAPEEA